MLSERSRILMSLSRSTISGGGFLTRGLRSFSETFTGQWKRAVGGELSFHVPGGTPLCSYVQSVGRRSNSSFLNQDGPPLSS